MYRIQVYRNRKWVWGLNDYATEAEAKERLDRLTAVGIKARIRPLAELLAR